MAIVVFLLVTLVAIVVLAKLGLSLGGKNAHWLGLALPTLGVVALPGLLGWVLDQFGVVERAVVADRRESIEVRPNGGWYPRYSIAVRRPGARSEMISLRADQPTYDALHFGDPVEVRSLPIRKTIVRLEKMSSSGWIRSAATLEWAGIVRPVAVVILGLVLIGGQGKAGLARAALAVALMSFGGLSCFRRVKPYQGEAEPAGPMAVARGTVRTVWRVGELYGGLGLAQPYFLVASEFTPAGARSSMLGIDAIDAGSVSHLELGDQIEVRYSSAAPRRARLGFGTRTFARKNQATTRAALGLAIGALVALAALRWWFGARRRPSGAR